MKFTKELRFLEIFFPKNYNNGIKKGDFIIKISNFYFLHNFYDLFMKKYKELSLFKTQESYNKKKLT